MSRVKLSTSQAAWTRLIILGVALLNQLLEVLGMSIIPIADQDLSDFISLSFLIGASLYTAWRNNSVTKVARYKEEVGNTIVEKALDTQKRDLEKLTKNKNEIIIVEKVDGKGDK